MTVPTAQEWAEEKARELVMRLGLRDANDPALYEENVGIALAALVEAEARGRHQAMPLAMQNRDSVIDQARAEGERIGREQGLEEAAQIFEVRGCSCGLEKGHLGDCPQSSALLIRRALRGKP